MKYLLYISIASLLVTACSKEPSAEEILAKTIKVYGGEKIYNSNVAFDFRDKHYKGSYSNGNFKLSRHFSDKLGNKIIDVLTNDNFERSINDSLISVTDKWKTKYSNSINSVFYFFRVPFNLKDPAVILSYLGTSTINGKTYYKLKVAFNEEEGGEDFDDLFVYWISSDSYKLDYFAYEYSTDGGGKRFRKAINQRYENGWLISDFINYKPKSLEIEIEQYDSYFEEDGFKKLSKIINKNVAVSYN